MGKKAKKAGFLVQSLSFVQTYLLIYAAALIFGLIFFLSNLAQNVHLCLVCMYFLIGALFWIVATPIIAIGWFFLTRNWDNAAARQEKQGLAAAHSRTEYLKSDAAKKKYSIGGQVWGFPHFALLIVLFIVSMTLAIVCVALGDFYHWGFIILSAPLIVFAITLPAVIWVSFIFSWDRYEPEPRKYVLGALFWGMMSTLPSFFLNTTIGLPLGALSAVLVAPPVEEFYKAFGFLFTRKQVDNELDGMIYGICFGVGFSVIENLLYGFNAYSSGGVAGFAILTVYRSVFSLMLHVMGPVMVGFLYGMAVRKGWGKPFQALAVGIGLVFGIFMHALWNGLATLGGLGGICCILSNVGLFAMAILVELPILIGLLVAAVKADRGMFKNG